MTTLFEQNGGTYSVVGDYRIPNLTAPEQPEYESGLWGLRRLDYMKKHKRALYTNLLTSGKLPEHLHEIDTAAFERIKQMMAADGVTEQLKAENPMLWVQRISNIRNRADEIIRDELIYS